MCHSTCSLLISRNYPLLKHTFKKRTKQCGRDCSREFPSEERSCRPAGSYFEENIDHIFMSSFFFLVYFITSSLISIFSSYNLFQVTFALVLVAQVLLIWTRMCASKSYLGHHCLLDSFRGKRETICKGLQRHFLLCPLLKITVRK